jgi:hypothetical protein
MRAMDDDDLVRRLSETLGISPREAQRVVGEILAHYGEPIEQFVRRRHEECRRAGQANPEAFATIVAELPGRVVAAPALTERQVRRLIYG